MRRLHAFVVMALSLTPLSGCKPLVVSSQAAADYPVTGQWLDKLTLEIDHGQRVGEVVNLSPAPLPAGMSASETDTELRRNGYLPAAAVTDRNQHVDTRGATPYSRVVSKFPCNYTYIIWVSYDDQGGLVLAQGTRQQDACV